MKTNRCLAVFFLQLTYKIFLLLVRAGLDQHIDWIGPRIEQGVLFPMQ